MKKIVMVIGVFCATFLALVAMDAQPNPNLYSIRPIRFLGTESVGFYIDDTMIMNVAYVFASIDSVWLYTYNGENYIAFSKKNRTIHSWRLNKQIDIDINQKVVIW